MQSVLVNKLIGILCAFWTVVIFGLLLKDSFHLKESIVDLASAEARTHYNKDLSVRLWAASQGGIYVPATETTLPEPHLAHHPDRDLATPSGKHLTLMNPAHLSRHMMQYYSDLFGTQSHFTCLNPSGNENPPDDWEKQALLALEDGHPEMIEIAEFKGESFLRWMRPIRTDDTCRACHTQAGDIQGGISVLVPMQPYMALWRKDMTADVITYAMIWLLGFSGLLFYQRQISGPLRNLEQAEASLRNSQENYRTLVENALTGICVCQDRKIILANHALARIYGYALHDIIGMDAMKLVHPEDRPMVLELTGRRNGGLPKADEYRFRGLTKSGSTIYVQKRVALTTFNGRPAVIGNEIDVTGQMVAESEMAASERQLRRLADGLIELREIEHERFAKEIHENIAQCISAIKFKVESALREKEDDRNLLQPIVSDFQHTMGEILKIARQYKPLILDHVGIIKSIAWLCAQFEATNPSLKIQKAIHVGESDFPDALKIIVFRMVEQILESLSNRPSAAVHIGMESISQKIVFFLKTNISITDLAVWPSEDFSQGELAMIALKRRCERFGGSFLLSSANENETLLIATWDLYCKYPPDSKVSG